MGIRGRVGADVGAGFCWLWSASVLSNLSDGMFWVALPLGALLGGIVGQAFGLTAVFWGAAAMSLLLLPARLLITDARI